MTANQPATANIQEDNPVVAAHIPASAQDRLADLPERLRQILYPFG